MFKELVDLWKARGIMIKAVDGFGSMLEDCSSLYQQAWDAFTQERPFEQEKEIIYNRDKAINSREREIRRLLVEHLTINPGQDASGCLALMSMVKDAERIGDYAKNIFDLTAMVEGASKKLHYLELIQQAHAQIQTSLIELKPAFLESSEEKARAIITRYQPTKKLCNKVFKGLFTEDMPSQDALVTVLLARYLKRINSHVSNVASGIIFPLDKIDFVRGGLLE